MSALPNLPPAQSAVTRVMEDSRFSSELNYQYQQKIRSIAIYGYADAKEGDPLYQQAFDLAKRFAELGYTIVNGGGPGTMAAATKGAQSVGGKTVTVTFYPTDAPGFEGRFAGNVPDVEIVTHNYYERMHKLMEHADAYIILNGGTGTISEFGTAWVMARLYYGKHKPFILYGEFWKEILAVIEKNMMMRGNENDVLKVTTTIDETVRAIQHFDKELAELQKKMELAGSKSAVPSASSDGKPEHPVFPVHVDMVSGHV